MYNSEHSDFILTPLFEELKVGISACRAIGDGIETYPLSEYIMQSLFLKLTGAQEQKMKCICWDIATLDYEYRYEYQNKKGYGECSDWKSKNGVYNDIIEAIQKVDSAFTPNTLIDASFLSDTLNKIMNLYDNSVLSVWQNKELAFYKQEYSSILNFNQIGKPKQNNAKVFQLFQSTLKDKFEMIVYKHRNRCAHNTLSYQINKPDLSVLSSKDYEYHSYFFRYAIIVLIDSIYMRLFRKYLSLQPERI